MGLARRRRLSKADQRKRRGPDYELLTAEAATDQGAAFLTALKADDATAVALASIVDPSADASSALQRLKSFAAHYGATAPTTEAILGILEQAGCLEEELRTEAESLLEREGELPPLGEQQADRARALIFERDASDARRTRLLYWLWEKHEAVAVETAKRILGDPEEAYSDVARQAIHVVGSRREPEMRTVLRSYADRHFEGGEPQADEAERQPRAALFVVNAIRQPEEGDLDLIGSVLHRAAQQALTVEGGLRRLVVRLTMQQVAALVAQLDEAGHGQWVARQFLPGLIAARPRDCASTAACDWWPEECLGVFARTSWEAHDDKLYILVLRQLHETGDETACATIRHGVAERCAGTSSNVRSQMPRIGARALLKLALAGSIETDDPDLLTALGAMDEDSFLEEIRSANWRRAERAHRVGEVVAQVGGGAIRGVVSDALEDGRGSAAHVIRAASSEKLDECLDELLEVVAGDEECVRALCEKSATAAETTLQRWQAEHSMVAFRALESTSQSEARMEAVPTAVRAYGELTSGERAELLDEYGPRDERVEPLSSVLRDRSRPPGKRPSSEDLSVALERLGEHLAGGLDPQRVLSEMAVVCTEAREASVRKAAYCALANASPNPDVVDLLLERQAQETASVRPAAAAALGRVADTLEKRAADAGGSQRREATAQLARIDPQRSLVHARSLLTSEHAAERMTAAEVIGRCGGEADADNVYGRWVSPLVEGIGRVVQFESKEEFGSAIDQLSEVGRALLFRALEIAGDQIGLSKADQAKAATNSLEYGEVVRRQQIAQNWPWVSYFASLHGLRTEHIAPRGRIQAPPARTADDLENAYAFFRLGAHPCCQLLMKAVTAGDGT